jgi:hypothetical protein
MQANSTVPVTRDPPPNKTERPVFVIRLEALPGVDPTRGLRWLLKTALRVYGLRCVDARELRR